MLNQFSLVQLACRASNLAERLFLLRQIEPTATHSCRNPLTATDLRSVQQDLEMLFPVVDPTQDQFYGIKRRSMKRSLRLFRWYERNLDSLTTEQRQVFLSVHGSWIQTYEQAMTVFCSCLAVPDDQDTTAVLAEVCNPIGCAPFLKLIETELSALFESTQRQGLEVPHPERLILAVQQFFGQRIAMMMTHSIQETLLELETVNAPSDLEAYHSFYLRFPVLVRWLSQVCTDILQFVKVAIARLLQDRIELSQQLWSGTAPLQLLKFRLRQEEIQGQWTAAIDLRLADGQHQQLRYYPYALEAELGLQQLYAQLSEGQDVSQGRSTAIVCRSGYGYISAVQHLSKSNRCWQLGQTLAVRQLLGHQGLWSRIHVGIQSCSSESLDPADTAAQSGIQQGFSALDQWFCTQPVTATQTLHTYFKTASIQLCHRSPAAYLLLLVTAQQSSYLANPLAVDAVFRALIEQPCPWDRLGEIAQLEVKMLWQFKALYLTIPMNHRYMLYDAEHVLFSKLPLTPLEFLARRISHQSNRKTSKAASDILLPKTVKHSLAT
jgi:Domain of unknown function (DUF4135)